MLAPPGTTTVMADGVNYLVSNGSVTVPASLVNSLEEAGFIEQSAGSLVLPAYATDASGNVTGLVGPSGFLGKLTNVTYNANGSINTYTMDGATYTVNYAGGLVTSISGVSTTTTFSYDASNRVVSAITA